MAKKYAGTTTINAILKLGKDELAKKVNVSDVAATITSASEELTGKVSDAESVKTLDTKVESIKSGLTSGIETYVNGLIDAKAGSFTDGLDAKYILKSDIQTEITDSSPEEAEGLDAKVADAKSVQDIAKGVKAVKDGLTSQIETYVNGLIDAKITTEEGVLATTYVKKTDIVADPDQQDQHEGGTDLTEEKVASAKSVYNLAGKVAAFESGLTSGIKAYITGEVDTSIGAVKGQANGLAPLDASSKIDAKYLPSYVDDVLEVYVDTSDGIKVYQDAEKGTAIESGEQGKIYVDITEGGGNNCYRWSGSAWVKIVSDDLVEITDDEITEMWNSVVNPSP